MARMKVRRPPRVAVITVHSSPTDQPGTGDSGGMNVYIREVAGRLNDRGVEVDVFTRGIGRQGPEVAAIGPATRVIQVPAGPPTPILKSDLPRFVKPFAAAMLARRDGRGYDLVQSHYWISGLVARGLKRRWAVPLVALFHTLGRVKNRSLADGDTAEPEERIRGEEAVLREADRVVLPTPSEASNLQELYRADPGRIRLAPPGVDTHRFRPRDRARARARMGLDGGRVVLFAGRLQPLKGPDVAVNAMAELVHTAPDLEDLRLVVVGGPSPGPGPYRDGAAVLQLARALGIGDRVHLLEPVPHDHLPWLYAAADVLVMPSRSESFGMVALEAQACGLPVVASCVGGLRHVVADGRSGVLVRGHDPGSYAAPLARVLRSGRLARAMGQEGVRHAETFGWDRTAGAMLAVYRELRPELFGD